MQCKKYFDSGDYNMAKSKTKAHVNNTNGINNGSTTQAQTMPNSGRLVAPQRSEFFYFIFYVFLALKKKDTRNFMCKI